VLSSNSDPYSSSATNSESLSLASTPTYDNFLAEAEVEDEEGRRVDTEWRPVQRKEIMRCIQSFVEIESRYSRRS